MRRAAILLALLAACSRDGGGKSDAARPIEILVANDAETLDPRYATDAIAMRTTRLVHAGLTRLDPVHLDAKPYLAKSWEWSDARTLRIALRDDVHFHSGAPFRAADVVATIAAFQSPKVASRHARIVEAIGSVTADGEHAVTITLKEPHATLLTDLELPILRADEAGGPPRPDGKLDGLGPFTVDHREEGAIVLAPANGALAKPAHAVTIRTVHDENARALRIHAGRADLVVNGFSPTLLPSFADAHVTTRAGANLTYLLPRVDRGALADVAVRRRVAEAIDRERITRTLFAGNAAPSSTLLPATLWAHTDAPAIPFVTTPGPPLHLTLLTSTDRFRGTIARQLAQDFAASGIELEVVPLELGTMLARLGAGDFELAALQIPELTEPNILRVFMHSSNVPPTGANRGRLRDPDVDRLLDAGAAEPDAQKRIAIYAELERVVRERALVIPLWTENQSAVASDRAAGFQPSTEGRWLDLAALP